MDISKMMTKHEYRSWYMKIQAIISTHGFGYIIKKLDDTNCCSFLTEFGQRCEDCFVQDWPWHASLENNLHRSKTWWQKQTQNAQEI